MTNLSGAIERIKLHEFSSTRNVVFDWVAVILGLWMIGGIHLDAWAHHRFNIETFLTSLHVILYSGYMTLTVILLVTFIRNLLRGAVWREAMPAGYGLSLIGAALFIAGGLGDLP